MGGFSFVKVGDNADWRTCLSKARQQFQRSGFGSPVSIQTDEFVFDYYGKIAYQSQNILQLDRGDFIASAGTFIFEGKTSTQALEAFFHKPDHRAALREARGHFALVIRRHGAVTLLRDRNSSFEVFHDSSLAIISTSFLAVARTRRTLEINTQEVYEYVFQGVTFGSRTPLADVHRLDFGAYLELSRDPEIRIEPPEAPPQEAADGREALVAAHVGEVGRFLKELATLFGNRLSLGLSGGYDTRLLLALCRAQGVAPRLVVYGNGMTEDVAAAQRIAAAETVALRHIDKTTLGLTGPDDLAVAARENFEREDGLPLHGILERDHERFSRLELAAEGMLHIHGGGGEIYRNFFNTPDHGRSARQLIWSFFNGCDPQVCTKAFQSRDYEVALSAKIGKLLGRDGNKLSRRDIEYLYPHFRCRSWFGRENSLNSRYFHVILPFYEHQIVRQALRIPIRQKYFGNFESRMIRLADPGLARHMSNYGHHFAADAPLRRALADRLNYWYPPLLRRQVKRIKKRLAGRHTRSMLAAKPYAAELVGSFPFMSRYFMIDRIKDEVQFSRLCTLEYLCQRVKLDQTQAMQALRDEAAAQEIHILAKSLPTRRNQPQPAQAVL